MCIIWEDSCDGTNQYQYLVHIYTTAFVSKQFKSIAELVFLGTCSWYTNVNGSNTSDKILLPYFEETLKRESSSIDRRFGEIYSKCNKTIIY